MRPLLTVTVLLALTCVAFAGETLTFSVVTSTGSIPVNGMMSFKIAENGDLSGWVDLLYLCDENSLALGASARHDKLADIIPLVKGGGVCGYWSFRYDCFKARLYVINVSF
jgi:hypothetical protein